jgi:hypothetical protein
LLIILFLYILPVQTIADNWQLFSVFLSAEFFLRDSKDPHLPPELGSFIARP